MKVAVTGGAGFIGSHLARRLVEAGHDVMVIDDLSGGLAANVPEGATLLQRDLNDIVSDELAGVEAVWHLAAHPAEGLSLYMPAWNLRQNTMAFMRLIAAIVEARVPRLVFASSVAVYGANPNPPFAETDPVEPEDPYGVAKAAIERLIAIYGKTFDLDWTVFRLHNVYGPGQRMDDPYRNVVGIFLHRLLAGRPPAIFGDGEQRRAFTHIDDIVPALADAPFRPEAQGEIYNLGSETPVTVNRLARLMMDAVGFDGEIEYLPARAAEVKHAWTSSEKARRILDWSDARTLEESLPELVTWARAHPAPPFRYHEPGEYEITRGLPGVWRERGH